LATGIPASKLKGMGHSTVQSVQTDSEVRLCYEGKRSEQEILATPPAEITRLWQGEAATQNLNRLYYGDNLPILAALLRDPVVCGQVRLVYIRPGASAGRDADPFADAVQAVSAAGAILARTGWNETDSAPRKYKDTRPFSWSPGVFVSRQCPAYYPISTPNRRNARIWLDSAQRLSRRPAPARS